MIIEEIHIKNFKALQDVHLRNLPPLSVFVGKNGTGKTSLFRVFAFLQECLNSNVKVALQREGGLLGFKEVITRVMKELCGFEVSSGQVSRLTAQLDEEFEKWRSRSLPEIRYLTLDATYYKVRIDGTVRDCATLTAIGIRRDDGKRMILGVSCALSEAEVHWRDFLTSIRERGIGIPDMVTSDAHTGLKAALKASCNASPWQRCQFHLQQNAQSYITKQHLKSKVAADIKTIFNADSKEHAQERLKDFVNTYRKDQPRLATWAEENLPEGFAIFALPEAHRKRLRTSNSCESLNHQIKRRTRVVGLFPNEDSLLRLVTAVLIEISETWETGKSYLSLN